MIMRPILTLVVPVYNEIPRLLEGFGQITSYLTKQYKQCEILIIDDGSSVSPRQVLEASRYKRMMNQMIKQKSLRIIRLEENQGKGAALFEGIRLAKGKYVVFTDIDCSVPMHFLPDLIEQLKTHDIAIGSRRLADSQILVHQPFLREFAGRIFTVLTNIICQLNVSDVTCGFKGFRTPVAQYLFSKQQIKRWSFDAEVLYLARKFGYSIAQVPVVWSNKTGSRVRFIDTIRSVIDLLVIRFHDIRNTYKKEWITE